MKEKNNHSLVKLKLVEVHSRILTIKKAWQIIKEAGCDKFKEGDAIISEKHCNFFVNNGNAKSADIEKLINRGEIR